MNTQIVVRAETTVAATPLAVFERTAVSGHFHELFKGYGLIPAVVREEMITAPPVGPGSRKAVYNSDGTVLTEEVLIWEPGRRHQYQLIDGFKPPFSWMVRGAEGDWIYEETDGGTAVQWTYTWTLRHPLWRLIAGPIIGILFQKAMQQALDNLKAAFHRR